MTPPETPLPSGAGKGLSLAGFPHLEVMRQRKDFLAAARGRRVHMPGFLIQVRKRGDAGRPRIGFTCSKKVGNAVARNRAKRRLREIARLALVPQAKAGHDYVLIGRATVTAERPFAQMLDDLRQALLQAHA